MVAKCKKPDKKSGFHRDPGGARTLDPRLKRPLLYRLSYRIIPFVKEGAKVDTFLEISKANPVKIIRYRPYLPERSQAHRLCNR